MDELNAATNQQPFTEILKQITFDDPQDITKKETGLKIAKEVYAQQWANTTSYNIFQGRAAHWEEVERWSLGTQNMAELLPFIDVADANKSYAQIDMTPIMAGAQFAGTLVSSLSKNLEYPCVYAVDDDSIDEKEQRQLDALWRMKEVEFIQDTMQQTGVQMESQHAYVPDNEIAAKVYFELEDRLPKEIRFENLLEKTLVSNQYEKVLKPKLIRNNIVFNLEATKVDRESPGKYSIRACIPRNTFYSFMQTDTGKDEVLYNGEGYNLKVKDIRRKWGKTEERPDGLTEQQIYEFVKTSSENPVTATPFNFQFTQQYGIYNGNTPWDDYSGYVIDFEIQIDEPEYYVSRVDSFGKENIAPKKSKPNPTSERSTVIKKYKPRWYRCVYAPYSGQLIYWGKPDSVLLEQSSYTLNYPNNNGRYVPSLFERAIEPLRELALAKLKRKLLIGRLTPSSYRIDVEGARNVVTGTGDMIEWEEIIRIKTLTGAELWSSKGLNPNENTAPPITAGAQDNTLNNIIQLSQLIQTIEAELRVLLGVPVYLDGSNVGQRTAAKLAEGQTESASNVTGFVQNAHNQVMEETLHKICLMAWQDIVTDKKESEDDLINTKFQVAVKMRMTEYERELLEKNIDKWSSVLDGNGKPLLTPKDCFTLRQIDNLKLAELYLAQRVDENEKKSEIEKSKREQANIQSQQESAKIAGQQEQQIQKDKLAADKDMKEFESTKTKEIELLKGFLAAAGKDETGILIKMFLPAIQQLVPNISMPLMEENKEIQQGIQIKAQQEKQAQAHAYAQQQMQQGQGNGEQQESLQGMQEPQWQEQPQESMEQTKQ